MTLKPVSLNEESFKEYGCILGQFSGSPMADDDVITYWGQVAKFKFVENASAGVLFGHRRRMATNRLERHHTTPEMLVALKNDAVILVAKPSEAIEDLKAYIVKQGDAIVLNTGTWHWTPFPIDAEQCEFLVVFQFGTEANDLEIRTLSDEIVVDNG